MMVFNNSDEFALEIQKIVNSEEFVKDVSKAKNVEAARKRLKKSLRKIKQLAISGAKACDWFPRKISKNIGD